MSKISYLFIGLLLACICIFEMVSVINLDVQIYICAVLISLLGIPHGAIDHVIYRQERSTSQFVFYSSYFGLMILYFILWMYFPAFSMIAFLCLSGFHFGQSQFSCVGVGRQWKKITLYFAWGLSILSGLVIYNYAEISVFVITNPDLIDVIPAFHYTSYIVVLLASTVATIFVLGNLYMAKEVSSHFLLKEIALFGLIHLCFFILPLLVGFTLYFCTLHSMQVLTEEFGYLKRRMSQFSIYNFIKLLTPYSLISIVGIGILLFLSNTEIIAIPGDLLIFIMISILTLPHSIVMDNFYFKSAKYLKY
jgi:Brp/Blh family beta-carotene 15,15'-monooxygenase